MDRERERDRRRSRSRSRERAARDGRPDGGAAHASSGGGGGGGGGGGEPLSLEEILRRREKEKEEAARPRFVSKKEREAAALARRQQQVAERAAPRPWASSSGGPASAGGGGGGGYGGERRYDDRWDARRRDDDARRRERDDGARRREAERQRRQEEREREAELEAIKRQYLGVREEKKTAAQKKQGDKHRFNFEWNAAEDTSQDLNPLYNNPHEAAMLFGRGFRAGIDRREQKKQAAELEREHLDRMRRANGKEETCEEREAHKAAQRRAERQYEREEGTVSRHWADKRLEEMTQRDWRIFREDYNITMKGGRMPDPIRAWDEAPIPRDILRAIESVGYKKPSPIQMAAIPIGLQQRDVIGIAETGSGKTCAFVVPMLVYIMKLPPMTDAVAAGGPYALVMAPTRELAQQIEGETNKFARFLQLRVVPVVGGQSIEEQGFQLRRGCEIVVGTPGRILDCLERRYTVLNQCNYIVLDEADRMIDLGFEPQVTGIMDAMPSSNLKPEDEAVELEKDRIYRTTYMFSATMPPQVEKLARTYMRQPATVTIGSAGKAVDRIKQDVRWTKDGQKNDMLVALLHEYAGQQVIVFVNSRDACNSLSKQLDRMRMPNTTLHGGKSQDQREASLESFRTKECNVLVATDVAGRGIDVPDVALVVNYDMPDDVESYTHRIGRTGRAGKTGRAVSFLTPRNTDIMADLRDFLAKSGNAVPPELANWKAPVGDKSKEKGMAAIIH